MEYFPAPLEKLVEQFAKLPGVGYKSAQRLAFHVLSLPEQEAQAFADAITDAKRSVTLCPVCQNLTDQELCGVCAGVADYFGIDPTIVRVIWALLAFFYGTSILLYVIMALVVPEQPAGGGVIDVDSEVREPSEKKEKYKGPEID